MAGIAIVLLVLYWVAGSGPNEITATSPQTVAPEKTQPPPAKPTPPVATSDFTPVREAYLELLNFKDDPEFHENGFADESSKYGGWLKQVKNLRENRKLEYDLIMAGSGSSEFLRQLGMNYMRSKGSETDETKRLRAVMDTTLGVNSDAIMSAEKIEPQTILTVDQALELATAAVKLTYYPAVTDALAKINENEDRQIGMVIIVDSRLTEKDCKKILFDYAVTYQNNGPNEPPPNMMNEDYKIGQSNYDYNLIAQDKNNRKCATGYKSALGETIYF